MSRLCADKSVSLSYEALRSHQNHDCWSYTKPLRRSSCIWAVCLWEKHPGWTVLSPKSWFCLHYYSISEWLLQSDSLCQAAESQRVSAVLRNIPFLIFPGSWNAALNLKITVLISLCVWGIRHGDNRNLILSPQVKKGRLERNLGAKEFPGRTGGNTVSPDVFPVMRSVMRR